MARDAVNSYESCDDITLALHIKEGNGELFEVMTARYMKLISSVAAKYMFCADGYDISDFMQEGLLGLLSACKKYDANGGLSFKNFVMLCVENRFKSIIRSNLKKSSVPKDNIVPIDDSIDMIEDKTEMTPQELIESKEYIKNFYSIMWDNLSMLERKVILLHLSGYSYAQTAVALGITEKSVDNALQRIRKKFSR